MADSKLTALTEFAGTLAPDDWVYMVDKSDTSDDPDGSAFKIQVKNLAGRVLIQSITNTTAGEFDFNSIPSGYNRLVIEGDIRSDAAGITSDATYIIFNADTTASNYHSQLLSASDGATTGGLGETASPLIASSPGASSPTDSYANMRIVIENYTGARLKMALTQYASYEANDTLRTGARSVVSAITAAITRVRIRTDNHATDQLFGTLRLYGEM